MFGHAQVIEITAFFVLVGLFEAWERMRPARAVDRRASWKLDVACFALAIVVNRACTSWIDAGLARVAPSAALEGLAALRAQPGWLKILAALVVVDFVLYWIHRAQHVWLPLWRTHAFHHSVDQLWWFSGFRTSFLHSLIYNVPQAAIPMLVFHLSPMETGAAYAIGVLVQLWEHGNVDVDLGPLRYVLVSPKYHRIHHAAIEPHNKNFAPIFAFWDLAFGTWVDPRSMPRDFPLGLGEPVRPRRLPRMIAGV